MTQPPAPLTVEAAGRSVTIVPGQVLVIGRAQHDGLPVDDPRVSHRHVVLWFEGTWRLRNEGRNGVYLDGRRIDHLAVGAQLVITLAEPTGPAVRLTIGAPQVASQPIPPIPPAASRPSTPPAASGPSAPPSVDDSPATTALPPVDAPVSGNATAVHQLPTQGVTVGRSPDNTLVVDDLLVSRHHARLTFEAGAWVLTDLRSANGTYVDGRRITSERVGPQNIIGIGHRSFRLADGRLTEYHDTGAVTFEARNLTVVRDDRRILDDVSFVLEPNSMMVIVGPSGSGKSTLLKALTGTQPADAGQVGYGGRDLYSNYDEIRHRIGFVPQDDILHPQLTVHDALDYAGQLRFPVDVDPHQRTARVQQVVQELGLVNQVTQRVSTLSGGQRKRTSTAMELLTRPSLLFLDEPTSGLDINRDREVMTVLRSLADGGRTVVVVSHNVAYLGLADRILVLATGGQLAFYGPPDEALTYFGFTDYADMYAALETPRSDWRQRFEASPIGSRTVGAARAPIEGRSLAPTNLTPVRNQTAGAQFGTLCKRYLSVIAADRAFLVLMIALPLVLALFAHTVPGDQGLSILQAAEEKARSGKSHSPGQLLLVLIIGGCLVGGAASVREIVKERAIFERERAIGISWSAYLASKIVVLGVITGLQAIVLTLLGVAGSHAPDDGVITSGMFDVILAMIGVTVASMLVSLILSVAVANADRVMPLLVLVIMAQLLMSGGLFPVKGQPVLEQLSWLSPARWGFAAAAGVVGLGPIGGDEPDPLWKHSSGVVFGDLFMLVVLSVVYIAVTAALLRRIGQLRARPGGGYGAGQGGGYGGPPVPQGGGYGGPSQHGGYAGPPQQAPRYGAPGQYGAPPQQQYPPRGPYGPPR